MNKNGHGAGLHVGNRNFNLGLPRALGQFHLDGGGGVAVAGGLHLHGSLDGLAGLLRVLHGLAAEGGLRRGLAVPVGFHRAGGAVSGLVLGDGTAVLLRLGLGDAAVLLGLGLDGGAVGLSDRLHLRTVRLGGGLRLGGRRAAGAATTGGRTAGTAARGAAVIEKHFTLDKNLPGPDHRASLEPAELKAMVDAVRNIEVALGTGVKTAAPSEVANINVARKSIVAARDIKCGETFTEENITVKRPGGGINPMLWDDVIGKRASRDFAYDTLIEI